MKFIVLHHNAGVGLTTQDCFRVWQTRESSAHYQVEASGRVGQLVGDGDTAWHAGDWDANLQSIGIEHANVSGPPGWGVSGQTVESGAHLVAALCVRFGLGRPQWGVNVFPHSHFTRTACPGQLAGGLRADYMRRAQGWYDAMTGKRNDVAAANAVAAVVNGGDDMLMIHSERTDGGKGWRYALIGPRFFFEFTDGSGKVANGFARQIGASSVQVSKDFYDLHAKKAAMLGSNRPEVLSLLKEVA